jgi:hypothetical protein
VALEVLRGTDDKARGEQPAGSKQDDRDISWNLMIFPWNPMKSSEISWNPWIFPWNSYAIDGYRDPTL